MFRIGEFSQMGQVSVRTLRLYDELGLLKPAQIDRFTDYRYYSLEQLPRLNRILALKELGFSLEQIARLLDDNISADELHGMLLIKQAELEQEVEASQARLERVQARLRQIQREGKASPYEVLLKKGEPQFVAGVRQIVPTIDAMADYRCRLYDELYDWLDGHHIQPAEPELAIYYNREYTEENIDMEAAVAIGEPGAAQSVRAAGIGVRVRELPAAPKLASVMHAGRLQDVCDAIVALYGWVGANGYAASGGYRELHLFGRENNLTHFDAVTLEVQVAVEENYEAIET